MITERTKTNLQGVHPDLQTLWYGTEMPFPAQVIDGVRSLERQAEYVKAGTSKTKNSRHIPGIPEDKPELGPVSHAIDFAVWPFGLDKPVSWDLVKAGEITEDQEVEYYAACVKALKKSAKSLDIRMTWGHDWGWDHGHCQLSWDHYGLQGVEKKTLANSKTIAAAAASVPVSALQYMISSAKTAESTLSQDSPATPWIVAGLFAAASAIALVIAWERAKKIFTEGT